MWCAQASRQKMRTRRVPRAFFGTQPLNLLDGQMYQSLQSLELARSCLDVHEAAAVAGWPVADTMQAFRLQQPQPSRDAPFRLMKAIDKEQSLDVMEEILGSDPVLAYRFLLYTNSAAFGPASRRGPAAPRAGDAGAGHAGALAGRPAAPCLYRTGPGAPAHAGRAARQAGRATDRGRGEPDLQREMYLCSLFSQLDLLLHESVATILRRTPLNERIFDAIVTRSGPYAAVLQMSQALESRDPAPIRQLREQEEWEAEDLNRMLLRMLSELKLGMPQVQT